jgi:hypothetical protein
LMRKITVEDSKYIGGYGHIGAKRILAPWAPGRALFLASHVALWGASYLVEVYWVVYDFGSSVPVGGGSTKAEAIESARQNFRNRRLALRNEFIRHG